MWGMRSKSGKSKADQIPASSSYRQMKEAFRAQVFQPQQLKVTKAERLDYTVGDTVRHVKWHRCGGISC